MTRRPNEIQNRRERGGGSTFKGRGRIGRGGANFGRCVDQKPLPLMSRLSVPSGNRMRDLPMPRGLPPRNGIPSLLQRPIPPLMNEFGSMGRGVMNFGPMGRGLDANLRAIPQGPGPMRMMYPPLSPKGRRGSLLPPPPLLGPPGPGMFPPRLPLLPPPHMMGRGGFMPGRGMPRDCPSWRGMMFNGPRGIGGFRGRGMVRGPGKSVRGRGPKGKSTESPSRDLNKPWVTEAIKNEIIKKRKLHRKAKKTNSEADWEAFRDHRNKVTTMLREAKLEYIGDHPEEDVDKILSGADDGSQQVQPANKDAQQVQPADSDEQNPTIISSEGAEPMEEEGVATESDPSQDPEVTMKEEAVDDITEPN